MMSEKEDKRKTTRNRFYIQLTANRLNDKGIM